MGNKAIWTLAVLLAGCGDNGGGDDSDTGASTTTAGSSNISSGQDGTTTGDGMDADGTGSGDTSDDTSTGTIQDTTTGEASASTTHDATTYLTTNSDTTTTTDTGGEEASSGTTGGGHPGPEMGPYSSCLEDLTCEPGDWTRGVGPMGNPIGCVCSTDCGENMACPPVEGIKAVPTCKHIQVGQNQFADMCKLACDQHSDCFDGMVCEDVGYGPMCIYGKP